MNQCTCVSRMEPEFGMIIMPRARALFRLSVWHLSRNIPNVRVFSSINEGIVLVPRVDIYHVASRASTQSFPYEVRGRKELPWRNVVIIIINDYPIKRTERSVGWRRRRLREAVAQVPVLPAWEPLLGARREAQTHWHIRQQAGPRALQTTKVE